MAFDCDCCITQNPDLENVQMLKGFRDFIMRGNVVDLAVAVIIGAAFNAVVTSFTKDVLMQMISAVIGKPDFNSIAFNIGETPIHIGALLTAVVNFLIVACVIYFCVVLPIQWITNRNKKEEAATTKICPECLSEIPLEAKRCSHCAQPQAA